MKENFFISMVSLLLGIILPPILGAFMLGLMNGQPLFIFYPAVFMVALLYYGPLGLIGSIILVILARKDIKSGKLKLPFGIWLRKYIAIGAIIGAILALLPWVLIFVYEQSFPKVISIGNFVLLLLGIITGIICAIVFSRIWYSYGKMNL